MEKSKIVDFIEKYSLGGNIEEVVIKVKTNKMTTDFVSPKGSSMIGFLEKRGIEMEDGEFGIVNTGNFKKLLSVMNEVIKDATYSYDKSGESINGIIFSDGNSEVNCITGNTSVIAKAPDFNEDIPEPDIVIKLDDYLMTNFIKGKNALSDVTTFTIIPHSKAVKFVIGHSNIASNTVSFDVNCEKFKKIDKLSFDAVMFKEVLVANKNAKKANMTISGEGLMTVVFEGDDYKAQYYLVCKDEE